MFDFSHFSVGLGVPRVALGLHVSLLPTCFSSSSNILVAAVTFGCLGWVRICLVRQVLRELVYGPRRHSRPCPWPFLLVHHTSRQVSLLFLALDLSPPYRACAFRRVPMRPLRCVAWGLHVLRLQLHFLHCLGDIERCSHPLHVWSCVDATAFSTLVLGLAAAGFCGPPTAASGCSWRSGRCLLALWSFGGRHGPSYCWTLAWLTC